MGILPMRMGKMPMPPMNEASFETRDKRGPPMKHFTTDRPVRVGVFDTTTQASQAIDGLLAAGIAKNDISVICSNQAREEFFKEFRNPPLPTDHLTAAVATGGGVGAVIGGLVGLGALTAVLYSASVSFCSCLLSRSCLPDR